MKLDFAFFKRVIPLFIVIFCTSCATIFNSKRTTANIHTYPDHAEIILNKKDTFCCNVELVFMLRSGYPLEIKVKKDSLEKTVFVKPILSSTFIFPNLFSLGFYGIGYPLDLIGRKRFTYPNDIYINMNEKGDKYRTATDNQLLNVVLHIPLVNNYAFSNSNYFGGFGFAGSAELFVDEKNYLSFGFGSYPSVLFDLFNYDYKNYGYLTLSANHRFGRLHLGGGISRQKYSANNFYNNEGYKNGYGLKLEAQYQISERWYLSYFYLPLLIHGADNSKGSFSFSSFELNYKIAALKKQWNFSVAASRH